MKKKMPPLDSRRRFLQSITSLMIPLGMRSLGCQGEMPAGGEGVAGSLRPGLLKDFQNGYLVAVSPDGGKMCIYFTKHPLSTSTFGRGRWTTKGGTPKDDALVVIRTGSWERIYVTQLREEHVSGGFFADSEEIYAQTSTIPPDFNTYQVAIIDLHTPTQRDKVLTWHSKQANTFFYPLEPGALLGLINMRGQAAPTTIVRAELPDYRETLRASFAAGLEREPPKGYAVPAFSADRKRFVYGIDGRIVVRRAGDLGVVWTRRVLPGTYGLERVAIAADGQTVAALISDKGDMSGGWTHAVGHVGVFAGADGRLIASLAMEWLSYPVIALSADGERLAVGMIAPGKKGIALIARLYDVASARVVGAVEHDNVPSGRYQNLLAHFDPQGLAFTPDGKHLITSGNSRVKVWGLAAGSARK
jgi:hypothetical protein